MMNPIAIIVDRTQIPWNAILIVLSIAAWHFSACSYYSEKGVRRLGMWLFMPFGLVFSFLFSRLIFWYSHIEQYPSLSAALMDQSADSFAMLGIIPGIALGALLVRLTQLSKSWPAMMDSLAPATAMGCGLLYLTCLFNNSCRGKFLVERPALQHLPFAAATAGANGTVEYRFATFFISFLVMMAIWRISESFYFARKKEKGATACFALLVFCSCEFILDSTRYDAGYFPFNGFVSILQIFAGVAILALGIFYSVKALKLRGFKWYFILLWIGQLGSMSATGYLEYLVQRHGDKFAVIYFWMSISCLLMIIFPYCLYELGRKKEEAAEKAGDAGEETAEIKEEEKTEAGPENAEDKIPVIKRLEEKEAAERAELQKLLAEREAARDKEASDKEASDKEIPEKTDSAEVQDKGPEKTEKAESAEGPEKEEEEAAPQEEVSAETEKDPGEVPVSETSVDKFIKAAEEGKTSES
ncbi:MAG: prolipoprotein diacylglyceryl transferase [Lachnospiraceae bacterium]|nr:prolipoprotein diacylglyceryl transferase [Lachnospiraceae bacterium]